VYATTRFDKYSKCAHKLFVNLEECTKRLRTDRAKRLALPSAALFVLPSYARFPENGRTIRWQVGFATAPSAITIQLQTAMNDVDAQYAIPKGAANMTTSLTAGDNLVASGVPANFVRAKVTSITGGSGVAVQIPG
jgi:hypothetical protein